MKLSQLKFKSVYIFLLLLVLSFLFFGSALNTALLSDDWHWLYLAKNTAWSFDIFFTNYEGGSLGGSYNPLMLIIFKLFYSLFSLNSSLYHLVGIILHAFNAFIVYLLANKLFILVNIKNKQLSLLAGALFLIWPTQVELVNWLAAWPHLWVTTFYLSAFLFYLLWRQKNKLKFLGLSLFLFILALFIKEIAIGGTAALIIIGGIFYSQIDKIFPDQPTGPGSGEEMEYDPMYDGPGSGEFAKHDNPGSDDYNAGLEHDPVYDGPGSGEFDYSPEPTGPGSGEELPYEPEPRGPGSDDYYAGLEDDGPGSGEENNAVGSCNVINDGSVCTDFIGNFWNTPDITTLNCQGVGIYSDNPCPQPSSGGCQNSIGTDYETIIWYYPYGGDPVTGELITYAAGTCAATGGTYLFTN